MPDTKIYFFQNPKGDVPLLIWLESIDQTATIKCIAAIKRLELFGNTLRRPTADYLRNGIYELRIRHKKINFRILYFFIDRNVAILSHGLKKEKRVPNKEIKKALGNKQLVSSNFSLYTYRGKV